MSYWKDEGRCNDMQDIFAIPEEEWDTDENGNYRKDPDSVRVKRSIWWYFYEGYETDPTIPPITDAMCYSCPMIRICFDYGTDQGETGVHGGVYLLRGNIDETKNSHKTEDDWNRLRELLDVRPMAD